MKLDYHDYVDHYMRVRRAVEMVTWAFLGGIGFSSVVFVCGLRLMG